MIENASDDPRPFAGIPQASLVLPQLRSDHPDRASLDLFTTLILRELPELEAEVGCQVVPVEAESPTPGKPAVLIGPADSNASVRAWRAGRDTLPEGPLVAIERDTLRVVIDGASIAEIGDAMQLLRTAIAERRALLTRRPAKPSMTCWTASTQRRAAPFHSSTSACRGGAPHSKRHGRRSPVPTISPRCSA